MTDFTQKALEEMAIAAKKASHALATLSPAVKNSALEGMAQALLDSTPLILEANAKDIKNAIEKGLSDAMTDRLRLDEKRIKDMADAVRHVVTLPDPVGRELAKITRPNGLVIKKVSVPIGVIGIIFESRPNVTCDAAALCIKSGNAAILRGGSEAIESNRAIAEAISKGATANGLPEGAIQLIPWTGHDAVSALLKMDQYINLIMPRGGERLIRAVVEQSTIPVIKHYKGVCHIYVDDECDMASALDIIVNAKCQRPGVCNAAESVLISEKIAPVFVPLFAAKMAEKDVEIRGDEKYRAIDKTAKAATEEDYYAEYLALILAVRIVSGVEEAVEHINTYGSGHSDAIVTTSEANGEYFLDNVDSSSVYLNASTRFTDGGEFGMGAEIGISTDKLHARGPMGLEELTSYKYKIFGTGQTR